MGLCGRWRGRGVGSVQVRPARGHPPEAVQQIWSLPDHLGGERKETVAGQCQLTLMIAEVVDLDRAAPGSAARLRFAMQSGHVAAVDSQEGPEMLLTCGAEAATLRVTRAEARP
jgi:hypothetical protein